MILQRMLLPGDLPEMDARMAWRADDRLDGSRFYRGCRVRFDTYFNGFFAGAWLGMTQAKDIALTLRFRGRLRIEIRAATLGAGQINERILFLTEAEAQTPGEVEIPIAADADAGLIYPVIEALSDEAEVYGGHYACQTAPVRDVRIAMNVCTYRREEYVYANLAQLKGSILENADDPLHGRLSVYLTDNGRTLDADAISGDGVHVFPNANAGGSGGFARGMLEILQAQTPATHVMICDDDIVLHPETLRRLYAFLSLIRPEYAGRTVAGAMFRMDQKHVMTERAGFWKGQLAQPICEDFDMRDVRHVLIAGEPTESDYNAWWCSVIPLDVIREKGLPLPLFIRFDDVEYGLRTGGNSLPLNGVCVWHEPFEHKHDIAMEYYHARNGQIVNALHRPRMGAARKAIKLARLFSMSLLRCRYDAAECVIEGAADYLKGPDWLMRLDCAQKHAELRARNTRFLPIQTLSYDITPEQIAAGRRPRAKWRRALAVLTLNGFFARRNTPAVVPAYRNDLSAFWGRTTIINLTADGAQYFISERDNKRALRLIRRFASLAMRFLMQNGAVVRAYRAAQPEMTRAEFWRAYLKLPD
jgi:galactofuranosylgalactofuranosylrhamnosyl-N-acetylglucosaminyl-diphospho-decaprenol beta-1,5/1,6-galactofuranosyltransferase